jgi:hypothetical protein
MVLTAQPERSGGIVDLLEGKTRQFHRAQQARSQTGIIAGSFQHLGKPGIVCEITGGNHGRLYACNKYLKILNEGTGPLKLAENFGSVLIWRGARIVLNPQRLDLSVALRVGTPRAPAVGLNV